jgi:tetratricopeptide (TPR) repeat protein
VFINYRGVDSRSYGALLYAELSRAFGPELVFLDSESIPAGADFAEQLLARVRGCRVLLAVIGPRWLTTAGTDGRCIDDPVDWVRRELAEALAAGVRVIPVLTDDAGLPAEADLPEQIAALGRCQYRRLRHREATADLDRLHADLTADPDLRAAAARRGGPAPASGPAVVPAQLPANIHGFAGRVEHLARLDALLTAAGAEAPTAVVITAVSGTAGVGKTALAVHWAHQVAARFPDGQLHVNLRGFDPGGQVMDPASAVRGFLDALGVPKERIPVDLDAQAALYRSLLAGRRVLVVIDNARDAEHTRPLLPGSATAVVVVTSRDPLAGLVADGAHPLTVDLLPEDEAHGLLARRVGAGRVAAEPDAADRIIAACARLPLALSLVAARAATHRSARLADLAAELPPAGERTGELDTGDLLDRVQAVFSWSYATLTPPAARVFRLLGLHPGPTSTAPAAAGLTGLPLPTTRRALADLVRAGLLAEPVPGRYGLHDLLRAYATDLTRSTDTDQERHAAVVRLLDHYVHTAHTAARHLDPNRAPIEVPLAPPTLGAAPGQPADHAAALGWLNAERLVLLAAQHLAAGAGYDAHTWQLAWALDTFLDRRGHWHDWAGARRVAVSAAARLPHPAAAYAHLLLGWVVIMLGDNEQAHTHLTDALHQYTGAADPVGQAHSHHALGWLWGLWGRPDRALDHAQQALTLFQAAGHSIGQAEALNGVGWSHALLGEHNQAVTHCQQALTLFQQVGERAGQAAAWDSLGYAHHHLAHHAQAVDCYQHALTLLRDLGDRHEEAATLTHLGDSHHAADHPDHARTAWTTALDILTDLDHPDADTVRAKLATLDQIPSTQPGTSRPA